MDLKTQFNEYRTIPIGLVGEHNYRRVRVNVAEILNEYPNARFELILQREGDEIPYPVATHLEETELIWTVQDVDVAVKGTAKAEILVFDGTTIAKSKIFFVSVGESMDPAGEVPDPYAQWYADILNASSVVKTVKTEVLNAKDIVLETAETVETKKNEAISAAQFAHEFKTLAESFTHGGTESREGEDQDNAQYYFEQAKQTVSDKANKPTQVIGTLYASRWVDDIYTFTEYPFAEYDVAIVNPTVEATKEEMEAYENMKPRALLGVNAFKAEEVPTIDIPVLMEVTLK